jgi:hypothetical protein
MRSRSRARAFDCLLLLLCSALPASAAHVLGQGGEPFPPDGVQ